MGRAAPFDEGELGMGRTTEEDAAAAYANGKGPHERVEATLSPRILELILRFTVLDGTATFNPATFARSPLPQ
jgi:hypothetical protein